MPSPDFTLPLDQVHVWTVWLDQPYDGSGEHSRLLSPEELERAARFRFERDRVRFVAARGTLRMLLGRYLRTDPAAVQYQYGAFGKPSVEGEEGKEDGLSFNISHSNRILVCAFVRARAIGVDVEMMNPKPDLLQIADRFFSTREKAALQEIAADQRVEGFYNCWTRKEAFVKAMGAGLSCPLDQFAVSLKPEEPACLLWLGTGLGNASEWSLHAFSPAPGYAGALALQARELPTIRFFSDSP